MLKSAVLFLAAFIALAPACQEQKPDFVRKILAEGRFTEDSESKEILEFSASSIEEAQGECDAHKPVWAADSVGGGIEAACLQELPARYSCICLLKLHAKNQASFKEYVLHLKQE